MDYFIELLPARKPKYSTITDSARIFNKIQMFSNVNYEQNFDG